MWYLCGYQILERGEVVFAKHLTYLSFRYMGDYDDDSGTTKLSSITVAYLDPYVVRVRIYSKFIDAITRYLWPCPFF